MFLVLLDEVNLALSLDQPTWQLLPSPKSERIMKPMPEFHSQVSRTLDRLNTAHVNQRSVSGLQVDIAIQTVDNGNIAIQLEQAICVVRGKGSEMSGHSLFQCRLLRQLKWNAIGISNTQWPTKEVEQDKFIAGILTFVPGRHSLAESHDLTRDSPDFHLDFTRRYTLPVFLTSQKLTPENGLLPPTPQKATPIKNTDSDIYSQLPTTASVQST